MFVNKIGKAHIDEGMNCQDAGLLTDKIKLVCDGCSEGKHSEVGVKLFCFKTYEESKFEDMNIHRLEDVFYDAFHIVLPIFRNTLGTKPQTLKDYLSFTIVGVCEKENYFDVCYCGDGYIIKQDYDDNIDFVKLDGGDYPEYYVYRFIEDKSKLKCYQDGVDFTNVQIDKCFYKRVGVASDGIRFALDNPELRDEFINILKEDKEVKMKRFINKHQSVFKDDVTICF